MNQIKTFFKSLNHSIFFQATLILGMLCFLIVFYLMAFAFRPIIKTEQEKNKLLYQNALTSAETIIDYSLLNIHDIITKTSQENCIMKTIISPESGSDDSEILLSLSNLKGTSELINEAFLFIPATDKIYTSKYKLISRKDFYEKNIIDRYYSNSDTLDYISQGGRISKFFVIDAKIFMVRDFPLEGENRLGTFFIKIDVEKFLKILKINETILPNHLYVYSSEGLPLFQNDINYMDLANEYFSDIKDANSLNSMEKEEKLLIYTSSDLTNFKYLLVVDNAIDNNVKQLILLICPVVFICLIMAFFVSTKIMIPIKNLLFIANAMSINKLSSPNNLSNVPTISNNMSYLNSSFVNAVSSVKYLNSLLEKLKPDISDIIFKDLLIGKPMQQDDIVHILTNIDSPIKEEGLYNVMVITIEKNDAPYVKNNYLAAIENILSIKTKDFCSYHLQEIDDFIFAIIFQFNHSSAHVIKVFEGDLKNMLMNTSSYLQVSATIGTGKICKSIQDLHFSYTDALNPTRIEIPRTNASDSGETEPYYNRFYFDDHIKKLFDFIEKDEKESAFLFSSQLTLQIAEENKNLDEIRTYFSTYAEMVLNKLIEFKNIALDANTLFQITTDLKQTNEKDSMKQIIDDFINDSILLAMDHYKKHNHPYILKAMDYIKTNYSDSSLSLSDIAEKLGTNATYLSKLFKENLGVNFNDTLNHYRIEKAKLLLINTDQKIELISNETGFNSQQNFIRVFKKQEGVAPGQYRKANQ